MATLVTKFMHIMTTLKAVVEVAAELSSRDRISASPLDQMERKTMSRRSDTERNPRRPNTARPLLEYAYVVFERFRCLIENGRMNKLERQTKTYREKPPAGKKSIVRRHGDITIDLRHHR